MSSALLPIFALLLTAAFPRPAHAQCGWFLAGPAPGHQGSPGRQPIGNPARGVAVSAMTAGSTMPDSLPPAVSRLLRSAGEEVTLPDDLVGELRDWVLRCDAGAGRAAVRSLRRAMNAHRDQPALRALLGTVLLHGPEVVVIGAHGLHPRPSQQLSNAELEGAHLLRRAAADDHLVDAGLELADAALGIASESTLKQAEPALKALVPLDTDGRIQEALASVRVMRGDFRGALKPGRAALALGDSAALRPLGIATLMTGDARPGADLYMQGLPTADPVRLQEYFDDLDYLLTRDQIDDWYAGRIAHPGSWLRDRWLWSASTAGLRIEQRLAVHFDRLRRAYESYLRIAYRGAMPDGAVLRATSFPILPLDDRGLLFVRHGRPDDVLRVGLVGATRIAWAYRNVEGRPGVFEFDKEGWGDYYLAYPATCPDTVLRAEAGTGFTVSHARLLDSLQSVFLEYGTALGAWEPARGAEMTTCFELVMGRDAGGRSFFRLREVARRSLVDRRVATALETETPRTFKHPIGTLFNTYAFRGPGGTDLYGFASIDGSPLTRSPESRTAAYRLNLSLAVENGKTLSVARSDTVMAVSLPAPLSQGARLGTTLLTHTAPAPRVTVRLTWENAHDLDQGAMLGVVRAIPDFNRDTLTLSDLVLAEPRPGVWNRHGHRLAPLPGHRVPSDAQFRLYYELYHTSPADPVSVAITIAPSLEGSILDRLASLVQRHQAIQIEFEEVPAADPDGVVRSSRDISANLERGTYTVRLVVRDRVTGVEAVRTTTLEVL